MAGKAKKQNRSTLSTVISIARSPFVLFDQQIARLPVLTIPVAVPKISGKAKTKKSPQTKSRSKKRTTGNFPTFASWYQFLKTTEIALPSITVEPVQRIQQVTTFAFAQGRPTRRSGRRSDYPSRNMAPAPTPPEEKASAVSMTKRVVPLIILIILVIAVGYQLYHKVGPQKYLPQPSPATQLSIASPAAATPLDVTAQSMTSTKPSPSALATVHSTETPATTKPVITSTPSPHGVISEQAAKTQNGSYTIKAGDTLWDIAQAQTGSGFNWHTIAQANNITDARAITAGQTITIPQTPTVSNGAVSQAPRVYTVQAGDNLWNIAEAMYGNAYKWPTIAQANHLADPSIIHAGNQLTIPAAQ